MPSKIDRLAMSYISDARGMYGLPDGTIATEPSLRKYVFLVGKAMLDGKEEVTIPIIDAAMVSFVLDRAGFKF